VCPVLTEEKEKIRSDDLIDGNGRQVSSPALYKYVLIEERERTARGNVEDNHYTRGRRRKKGKNYGQAYNVSAIHPLSFSLFYMA
jgi:hypothetical protein